MALRTETLASLKSELQSRRDTLARDLAAATAELIDDEMNFTDSVDQATQDTGKGMLVQMKNRDRGNLVQIDAALRRIEMGNFGVCDDCDEQISEARMRVNPATTLCIDCKSELESHEAKHARLAN